MDQQIKDLANSGQLNDVPKTIGKKGLHGLLAAVSHGERGLRSHANIERLRARVSNLRGGVIHKVLANEHVIIGQLSEDIQKSKVINTPRQFINPALIPLANPPRGAGS